MKSDHAERIRATGLRATRLRVAVLRALGDGGHLGADEVLTLAAREVEGTSLQAVYGVLRAFIDTGLARCIEPAGSSTLYEVRVGDNHHHLVCTECRLVVDVDCAVGTPPCLEPTDDHGFTVSQAEVTYWGLCPDCRQRTVSG